jgi:glycosyltransferase involved in cell wall biosynthesis
MRIVQLSTMMSYYGGEVHLVNLAAGMQAKGHDVCCVVRPGSDLAGVLPSQGLEFRALPMAGWFDPVSVVRLSSLLKNLGCDILHTHLSRDYSLAALATLGTPIANVGTRHLLRPFSHPFLKRPFLRRFSGFIAVSEAVRTGLLQVGVVPPEKVTVVHNGIDLPPAPWLNREAADKFRLQMGLVGDDPLIGFVGRLCPSKGVATLIDALDQLKERWPRLKLCLVGQDTPGTGYRSHLQDHVARLGLADSVRFAGYVKTANRFSGAFDIQVVPSLAEPFGLVTLEAMACGVPVVVTNTGGSPEIVRDGEDGFLFAPGDTTNLVAKLDHLLGSPALRREMGERGRQRVADTFSSVEMLNRTETVYRRVLES